MGNFDLYFNPRTTDAVPYLIRSAAGDLEELNARILGRATDLSGEFDAGAAEFTDVIGWNIKDLSAEDFQLWKDAASAVAYCASVTEKWADHVQDFINERNSQVREWNTANREKESQLPAKFQGTTITWNHPERGFFIGNGDENRARNLYDELCDKREELRERERRNWNALRDNAEETGDMLREGPTPQNVQKLIDGGHANWAFFNIDPDRYSAPVDISAEEAEQWAGELAAYWSGDKEFDERYDELMLIMSMLGTRTLQAQQGNGTFSQEEMAALKAFYDALEEQQRDDFAHPPGVVGVPHAMQDGPMTDEEREYALGVLGDGLLALSDHRLGGGYHDLPPTVRRAAEGTVLLPPDSAELYMPHDWASEAAGLAALLGNANGEMEAGHGLSATLTLSMGLYAAGASGHMDVWLGEEDVLTLVDVGNRNRDANHAFLTGDFVHPNFRDENGEVVPGFLGETPQDMIDRALEGLFTHEWTDDGAAVRGLTDWISEDSRREDPAEQQRAGEAAAGFIDTVTKPGMRDALLDTGVRVTEGDNEYRNASFTQFNSEIADSLTGVFESYIYSFANSPVVTEANVVIEGVGDYDPDRQSIPMGVDERAVFMQYLMGNDTSASRTLQVVDLYQQMEEQLYLETGQEVAVARGGGTLQGLVDTALEWESKNREDDLQKTIDRNKEVTGFLVKEGADLTKAIPVVGKGISKVLNTASDEIVNALVDQNIDVETRHPNYTGHGSVERNIRVQMLEQLVSDSEGSARQENIDRINQEDMAALQEMGVVSIGRDGSVSVERNPADWDVDFQSVGGADSVDQALSNAMKDSDYPASDGRTYQAEDMVGNYTSEYMNMYNEVKNNLK